MKKKEKTDRKGKRYDDVENEIVEKVWREKTGRDALVSSGQRYPLLPS